MVNLTIDDKRVSVAGGTTILEAAKSADIYIPTLCYHPRLSPIGACRLCVVEVEGAQNLVASCETQATPGMVVRTESPRVVQDRRTNIELLLASGYHNCLVQDLDVDSWTDFQLKSWVKASPESVRLLFCRARAKASSRCRMLGGIFPVAGS